MKTIKLSAILILLAAGFPGRSQNQFHMGQYMLHQPFINPAASGSYDRVTAALFHKAQWTSLEGAPTISGLNLVGPIGKNSRLGGTVVMDQIGVDKFTNVGLNYAYRMRIGYKSWFSLGVDGYANIVQSNLNELTTVDSNDPMFQGSPTFVMPNARFGAYFYTKNFYAGFSIPNLLENKVTVSGADYSGETLFNMANVHYYIQAGWAKQLNKKMELNLSGLIKQSKAAPLQFDLNAQAVFNRTLGVGLSYRTSNELLALVNYKVLPALKIGYAYEYNLGDIGRASNGSHEVIAIYEFTPPKKTVISVPRF